MDNYTDIQDLLLVEDVDELEETAPEQEEELLQEKLEAA